MKTILVIDDNDLVRKTVAAYLAREVKDSRVVTAQNGRDGALILSAFPVDLVLTDLDMPVMDGAAFIKQAAKIDRHIPIFVMTGSRLDKEEEKDLSDLGVVQFFEKPFEYDELTRMVSDALFGTADWNATLRSAMNA